MYPMSCTLYANDAKEADILVHIFLLTFTETGFRINEPEFYGD